MRAVWFAVGSGALSLGVVGVFVPLLPTTPFILLAAYAFARSSERWHRWLLQHRMFGPIIVNWRDHGAIGRRAKVTAILSLVLVFGLSLYMGMSNTILVVQAVVLSLVAAFILTRPLPPSV